MQATASAKEIVSPRGFCRRYHAITLPGRIYDTHAEWTARSKMAGLLAAPRTIEGVIAAMVNYDWMIPAALGSATWRRQAAEILALLDRVEIDPAIPMKGWR
jgi:hypothetical protein